MPSTRLKLAPVAVRIGVFGGTFDPIHYGHLVAAEYAAAQMSLDRVIFMPAGDPWQKSSSVVAGREDRYKMTLFAIADNPRFEVSRIEIDRTGPSYTIETLRQLRGSQAEQTELYFIAGADALAEVQTWHEPEQVSQLATFIGVTRPGSQVSVPELIEGNTQIVEVPGFDIASSDIRARLATGAPVRYLMPDPVLAYIRSQRLYSGHAA